MVKGGGYMPNEYSKDVIAIAGMVVQELQNASNLQKYKNELPELDLLTRTSVRSFNRY